MSSSEASTSAAKVSEYDVITVGAAANHSMGFKHGGLLDQLIQADDLTKRCLLFKIIWQTPYIIVYTWQGVEQDVKNANAQAILSISSFTILNASL